MKRIILLALALLLTPAAPVAAIPVHFDPPVTFNVPGCNWGQTFNRDGAVTPPLNCTRRAVEMRQFLPAGDPTDYWGTLAYYPGGFRPDGAVGMFQDKRVTDGGLERFTLPSLISGDYYFAVSLMSPEYTAAQVYSFTLTWPEPKPESPHEEPGPPLEATPEPATLLLMGTGLAVAGWVARKRKGRHDRD